MRKNDTTNFHNEDPIRLVKIGFAFCFKEARLSSSIGSDIEHNKFCRQVSTIMKMISNKGGDLSSQFDSNNEIHNPILSRNFDLPPQIRSLHHQKKLIDNHIDANKGKFKGCLYLEDIFGFFKNFKKVTKKLGFHLMLKTNNLQDIIYTSKGDDMNKTINDLYLFIHNLVPSVETQLLVNEATQNIYQQAQKFTAGVKISPCPNKYPRGGHGKSSRKFFSKKSQSAKNSRTVSKIANSISWYIARPIHIPTQYRKHYLSTLPKLYPILMLCRKYTLS